MKEIRESLNRYVEHKILPGGFLTAVLENNLKEAVFRADARNEKRLKDICMVIHWDLPSGCHGSPEKVKAWLNQE